MSRVESKIEFYAAVPISTDFKHEPLFDSKEEQIAYFDNFKVGAMTGSYQRVEEQIRTNKKYEHLLDVNYVHVINPSYEGSSYNCEWWGFVMDIHYDSDGLVYVDWVVDPVQTFMFKWDLSKAFIERGMLNVVKEKGNQYYLDNNLAPLLANQEEIGVDGLAYELLYDDLFEDAGNSGDVNFLVIALADAETMNFIGTPTQLTYYVLPYNTLTGQLLDFRVENVVNLSHSNKVTIETSKNSENSLATAVKKFADDVKLTNGGKSVVVSFLQKEIGLAFSYDSNKRKLTTKLGNGEWGGYNQNMELYEIGSKTSGGSSDGGSGGDSGDSGGSGGDSGSSTVPTDKKEFLKMNVGTNFNVDEAKFLAGAKQSARVREWLGSNDANIKRVADIVRKNGMSPELFFAYDIQEQGTSWGWLNHTYYTGDPYTDADSVSKWAVSQANTTGAVELAWYDVANPYYTTPIEKQKEGQAFANALPKGAIGRMYLSGTAAATWAAFDPEALKGSVNGVQDYGDPIQGCMDLLKAWQGSKSKASVSSRALEAKGSGWRYPFDGDLAPYAEGQQFGITSFNRGTAANPVYFHDGYDFGTIPYASRNGGAILAVHDGKITDKGFKSGGIGSYLVLNTGEYNVMYQEFGTDGSGIDVNVGDSVKAGQQVAHFTNGTHVHLGITKKDINTALGSWDKDDGTWLNPITIIQKGDSGGSTGGGGDGGDSGGDKPTPPQGSGIYALKINRFRFPKIAQKYVQLLVENKKNDYTKYRLIREALNITLGQTHPETINYINSLQGPKGLEKLCCAPFCTMTLSNGKGVQKNFNLANFKKQEAPFLVDVKGFLGKSNRVEFYFEHYLNYVVDNGEGEESRVQGEAAIRKDSLIDATMKNFDLYIDASKSYEYLNQNRISQSIDNAKFAVSQNNIQQSNSERNFALGQANTRNINSINQSGARKQLDNTQYGQWQQYGLQGAKTMVGALGGAAASIAQGGPVIGGAAGVAGAVTGVAQYALDGVGVMASQNIANQSLNIAQSTANAALAANQGTEQKVFYNNLTTSQLIASNQYENAIANINAGLADIRNEPDISAVSGSDYNFEVAWDNDSYYSILYTINPQALMIVAEFFAQFGYKIRRYDSISNYMKVKPSFNYIKTNGADVKGRISNKWRNALNMIFDSGITFWRDKEKMKKRDITGNY
ncbi:peptidoglycan DD-metalloendopeptidase family protein [Enterococcus faecium]|nr:peptidoglycan DD-metalloendopeptidase family protein [Enterococcus faecium]